MPIYLWKVKIEFYISGEVHHHVYSVLAETSEEARKTAMSAFQVAFTLLTGKRLSEMGLDEVMSFGIYIAHLDRIPGQLVIADGWSLEKTYT